MQDKFLKNTLYTVFGILLTIFLLIQPYNLFCRVKHSCNPIVFSSFSLHKNGKQKTVINFTAKVDDNLKNVIEFIPEKSMVDVQNGKIFSNNFIAKNLTNKNIVITNRFTVQPEEIGIYLERIECLCFKNQPIDSAKEVNMPVSFRINLEVEKDKNFENIKEITINYQAYLAE